jgi:RNA polymerase sigma factor (sigma-70 family)
MATQPTSLPGALKRVLSGSLSHESDRQLLERFARSGDEAAFAAIVDRHGPMLLGLCRRLLNDTHLADDVLQATFLVLARKAGSIRHRESLASWLYRVAQRIARHARLAEAGRSRRERQAAAGREQATDGDPGWEELLRVLDEELQRMPERYRSPLLLCYLEGRTQDEAAKHLGCSLSTLRRDLDRGRELLRARMTRRGATLGAGLFAGFLAPSVARATLTADLQRAVLTAALAGANGAAVAASVAALAKGGMRMASFAKIALWAVVAATLGGMLAGIAWHREALLKATEPSQETHAIPSAHPAADARPDWPAKEPAQRRDRFNDPLPAGAVARIGTVAFRHGRINYGHSLTFTPDGKHLVSTGGGWVRRWDVATRHATINLGDGWRTGYGNDLVTADARLARVCFHVAVPAGGLQWQCTEYDLGSGKAQRTYQIEFPRNTQDAHGLPGFLSPDGQTFAELNDRGKLTLWNAGGQFTHHIRPDGGTWTALAFTPDSRTVVVGDEGHTFRVFDVTTGKMQRSFGLLKGNAVARMAISPDGRWLVTAGGQKRGNTWIWPLDRFLRVWSLKEGTVVRTLDFPEDLGARSLLFTRDSRTVIAAIQGGRNGSPVAVRCWDAATGKPGRAWTEDGTLGLTLAVSPDGKTLAAMNDDGVIRLLDMETGRERNPREASPCALEAVCFRPDGKALRTAGRDQAVREWDAATGRLLVPHLSRTAGHSPAFLAGGELLMTYAPREGSTTKVRITDPATGKLVLERAAALVIVSPDGKRMAAWDEDRSIRVLDTGTGKVIQTLAPAEEQKAWPHASALRGFTSDGRSLILQGETVSVWDVQTGKPKTSWSLLKNHVLEKPAAEREWQSWERIEAVAVSPDGSKLAFSLMKDRPGKSGSRNWFGRIALLETATGKLLFQADADDETFESLTFSPDGTALAAGGLWTVRVWEVATGKEAGKYEGHRGRVRSVAFDPDGKRLASASEDSTVLVWDVPR